jgi:hypothetical protein
MPKKNKAKKSCIAYRGLKWIKSPLPSGCQPWQLGERKSTRKDNTHRGSMARELRDAMQREAWKWPKKPVYFFSDLHADTDAFMASLVASGGIEKTGPRDHQFKLTKAGKRALFIIGGDCFDKGPSSIRLLRAIRLLIERKAKVHILAGNHDVRMMLGVHSVSLPKDPRTDHFFVRMGRKMVPFLEEIYRHYLQDEQALKNVPSTRECRRRLFPPKKWFKEFPRLASWMMPDVTIEREMKKLRDKMDSFEGDCARAGLSLRMVYAAVLKWQELFLQPKGEFFWFFDRMQLAHREGSFLFIHAGLDDRIARAVGDKGVGRLNRKFRRQVHKDPFDFYYGPIANTIRTKYREIDMPLTRRGVELLHQQGIHVIVHGHLNLLHGQRIMLRKGMVNFECDGTVDRNTRKREGLPGVGAAVTVFCPEQLVMGISADFPDIKVFDPRLFLGQSKDRKKSWRAKKCTNQD